MAALPIARSHSARQPFAPAFDGLSPWAAVYKRSTAVYGSLLPRALSHVDLQSTGVYCSLLCRRAFHPCSRFCTFEGGLLEVALLVLYWC